MRTLEIDAALLDAIRGHSRRSWPSECCGILLGSTNSEVVRVLDLLATDNAAPEPERRFEIPPEALLTAQRRARNQGREVVGYYHSHPRGVAMPSESDRAEAWPGVSYVIVAGVEIDSEVRSWRLGADGSFEEQAIRTPAEVLS